MGDPSPGRPSFEIPPPDRLDSWKEIAAHLRRDVTTGQRWEKREGMPVHRHVHDKAGSVYAFSAELDAWARSRKLRNTGKWDRGARTHTSRSAAHGDGETPDQVEKRPSGNCVGRGARDRRRSVV
jgi:hypothetical protein